ncbi:MAG: [protein-PII] uridylyltransferase [Pseudomonadota bacterium]
MTPRQDHSLLASERATDQGHSDDLVLDPVRIFDTEAVQKVFASDLSKEAPARTTRGQAVAILKSEIERGLAEIARAVSKDPMNSGPVIRSYAHLTDQVVRCVFLVATEYVHPSDSRSGREQISVLAVGGYGRREMAPFSDVDLLFLFPYKVSDWAKSAIKSMLYMMWDLKLKVGHASRTIRECIKQGRDDYTIRTALLENRLVCGDAGPAETLQQRLWDDLIRGSASEFIEAKLAERAARHKKQGGQRYMTEPNVKEGKGGQRDLQSLFWIAKYIHRVKSVDELQQLGLFSATEFGQFKRAETFLWAVRIQLHLIAGRALEQLTFDMQVVIAERLGYTDYGGRRAVEHFMQDYFIHATAVGELTRIFLTALEASHVKIAPSLVGFFQRRKRVRDGYAIKQNRLTFADEGDFLSDRLNLLRIFEEALRTGYLLHPDAMRLISANLQLINDNMRRDPEANRIFLGLLLKHGNPERALRRMNELGVLATFIPEFAPVVAMMQFNMYHHYTVDEHTIQCISTLAQIERGELVEELPVASRILENGINRRIIYLALFFHDIGKGRDEDHSVLGAQIARRVCPRLGLRAEECETVEWLVRYHLLMSDMAQKRDLSDLRTVRDFAKAVRTVKRLDLLTVLTVCDIRGVGPGTWNNWKAMLLRQLYRETASALETGLEEVNRETRETEAKKALRSALESWPRADLRAEIARHYGPYWQGMPTETHIIMADLLRDVGEGDVRIQLAPDEDRDATQVCFAMSDHPGIFSRLSGALALVGANVVDARTYTSKDGYVTSAFWVQDAEGKPYEAERLPRLRTMIENTLHGKVVAQDALRSRDRFRKRESAFRVPTSISFDNEGSEIYTIIEVDTRDRPGLLFDVTRTLANANLYIASAVIATYGAQAVDTFYVKDMFGLKVHAENRQKALEKKLRTAIEKGVEQAVEG